MSEDTKGPALAEGKQLPYWLSVWPEGSDGGPAAFAVDPAVVYPVFLSLLDQYEPLYDGVNQYWLEVARRCFTEWVHTYVVGAANPLNLKINKDPAWALARYSVVTVANPDGSERRLAAPQGALYFQRHYNLIKDHVPVAKQPSGGNK